MVIPSRYREGRDGHTMSCANRMTALARRTMWKYDRLQHAALRHHADEAELSGRTASGPSGQSSFASSVISALRTRETGQLALAPAAISANFSAVIPGIFATVARWMAVIVQLVAGTFSRLRVAVVCMRSAVKPAPWRAAERAIVKQPAWAAAISSSGLVPGVPSNLVLKE